MTQFQFREGLVLDFGTVQFEVRPDDPDFLDQLEASQALWEDTFRKFNAKGAKADASLIRFACEGITASIETLLGKGAVAEIFGDRSRSFADLVDVVAYIRSNVDGYWENLGAEYSEKAPKNREQRRAAAKLLPKTAGDGK